MTDPFTTLGVPRRFRLDVKMLEQRHRDLSRALHPDRHGQASPAERRVAIEKAASVNDAFRALKDPQSRAAALLASVGRTVTEESRAEPALLMEILELREELEHARSQPTERESIVRRLRDAVQTRANEAEGVIAATFDHDAESPAHPDAIERAYAASVKLRYLYRFLEEADAILEESL